MKTLNLSICLIMLSICTAFAQTRNCDLSLRVVTPTENYLLPFGDTVDVVVCVKNNGPDSILRSDTLLIGTAGSNIYSAMIDTVIAPGDSLVWPIMSGWAEPDQEENDTLYTCLFLEHLPHYTDSVSNNDSLCFTVIFEGGNSTSLTEKNRLNNVDVYPNPSTGMVHVASQSIIKRIEVIDMMGRVVAVKQPNQTNSSIDLSNLPPSIYMLHIKNFEGKQAIQKIQKL